MRRLLRDIYSDPLLSSELRFKGGTAAMFFYGLSRFSTDLDFNLEHESKQQEVFCRLKDIVLKYGKIHDSADKWFGPLIVLDYGAGERKLKIEVSNRKFDNHYKLLGLSSLMVPVMTQSDMFTHKLCAMCERQAPRDVFDVWFFMERGWSLNPYIIKERTGLGVSSFLSKCVSSLNRVTVPDMMMEIGELLDDTIKEKVKSGLLLKESKSFMEDYISSPLIEQSKPEKHTELLMQNEFLLQFFLYECIDPSTVSSSKLEDIMSGNKVILKNKRGENIALNMESIVNSNKNVSDIIYFTVNGGKNTCVTDKETGDMSLCEGYAKKEGLHFKDWKTTSGEKAVAVNGRVISFTESLKKGRGI